MQRVDTALDQARHAAVNLPERVAVDEASRRLGSLRSRIGDLLREQGTLASELAGIEKRDTEIAAQLAKLEKQLRTVIAPREAEALQHEIRNLTIERGSADERGLQILEESGVTDTALAEARTDEAEAERVLAEAEAVLREAEREAERVIEELSSGRATLVASIEQSDLATYERLRASHAGVAIAEITHGVCGGCHMDISAGEMDAIKRLPADQVAECPNCTRLLLR